MAAKSIACGVGVPQPELTSEPQRPCLQSGHDNLYSTTDPVPEALGLLRGTSSTRLVTCLGPEPLSLPCSPRKGVRQRG